jgi:hypothetical protein
MPITEGEEDLAVGHWVVAFLDLAGARTALMQTDFIPDPSDREGADRLVTALRESVGKILLFHGAAREMASRGDEIAAGSPIHQLPADKRELARHFRSHSMRILTWSDSVVLYIPLAPDKNDFPAEGALYMLQVAAFLQLVMLSDAMPVRGGIDLGTGIEVDGQLFGPALVKPYELESKTAEYPRVVIGDSLVEYLHSLGTHCGSDDARQMELSIKSQLQQWVIEDFDRRPVVHFLGQGLREHLEAGDDGRGFVREADAECRRSLSFWRERNNEKLSRYYAELVRYFDLHAEGWRSSSAG